MPGLDISNNLYRPLAKVVALLCSLFREDKSLSLDTHTLHTLDQSQLTDTLYCDLCVLHE